MIVSKPPPLPKTTASSAPQPLSDAAPPYTPGAIRVFRSGNCIDMHEDAILPDRCIKCNCPITRTLISINVMWRDPEVREKYRYYRLLPVVRLFAYAIEAADDCRTRKRATVRIGLFQKHWMRRRITQALQVTFLIMM